MERAARPREVWLLRHAKADWGDGGVDDHDRPLSPRGVRAAALMAALIEQWGVLPQIILCSTALRARQTLDGMAMTLGGLPTEYDERLYLASVEQLLAFLRRTDDEARRVLLVGHNPGLEDLALALTSEQELAREAPEAGRARFPTAALCRLEVEISAWRELSPGSGRILKFAVPKGLV